MQPAARHSHLLDRLAADYVLGTMRGGARARFERWRGTSTLVDELARRWEQQLAPLAIRLRPVAPPPVLLARIQRRLSLTAPTWRGWASGLALGLLLAAVLAYGPAVRAPHPDQLALINNGVG
ncbi:MAG: hypothetical protein KGJ52_11430, partial [Gammaproteobacteria bacterium]|nr:hypothetical protein [Gammaproteobacteria bacterium]